MTKQDALITTIAIVSGFENYKVVQERYVIKLRTESGCHFGCVCSPTDSAAYWVANLFCPQTWSFLSFGRVWNWIYE